MKNATADPTAKNRGFEASTDDTLVWHCQFGIKISHRALLNQTVDPIQGLKSQQEELGFSERFLNNLIMQVIDDILFIFISLNC